MRTVQQRSTSQQEAKGFRGRVQTQGYAAVGLFVTLLDVGFALRRWRRKQPTIPCARLGGGGKDAVHGTFLRGQRPLGRHGGVEEDFDQNLAERKKRTEGRETPTGGGGEVKVEQRGSARSLAIRGARRSPGSRQRLSLSIIQFTRPRPYIFFNSSETTRGIVISASSAVFCRSGDSRERADFGVNPPPSRIHTHHNPPAPPPRRHLSSG